MAVTGQNGMSNFNRGPSTDASYHVSVHLAKPFQSRRFLEIDQSETLFPVAAMFVNDRDKNWSISKTAFPLKPIGQMI
jgi:hypothetical protein